MGHSHASQVLYPEGLSTSLERQDFDCHHNRRTDRHGPYYRIHFLRHPQRHSQLLPEGRSAFLRRLTQRLDRHLRNQYLSAYASASGGEIYNPNATSDCEFCTSRVADQFLSSVAISYTTRWRDYGIGFAFIFFNIAAAVLLYYFFRVRKSSGKGVGEKLKPVLGLFRKDPEKKNVGSEKKKAPQDQAEGENLA